VIFLRPLLIILFCLAVMPGCTASFVAPGEPAANIAIHSSTGLSITAAKLNGQALGHFANSVDVSPGEHKLEVSYSLQQENCHPGEYFCEVEYKYGICTATVRTKVDRNYLVTITAKYALISVRVSAKGYFDFSERDDETNVGTGSCRELSGYSVYRRRA